MQAHQIKKLFSAVARRYDFLNSLLSLRLDKSWRRETVKVSDVSATSRVLDVCTGTGELALAYSENIGAEGCVLGSDFCYEMLAVGKQKVERKGRSNDFIPIEADTLTLPFPDNSFDIVSVGFGIRNVSNLELGITEMTRVAVKGGKIVILEFTQPNNPIFRGLYYFYFTKILPFIGNVISRNEDDAYGYLPRSVLQFPDCNALQSIMEQNGLTDVEFYRKTFGIVAIHVGVKA